MKKIYLLSIAFYTIAITTKAQTPQSAYLDINNIKASVNSLGELFNGTSEIPKGSSGTTIYLGNLWIGGVDLGGMLKIAAQTYKQSGTDFFFGPLNSSGTYDPANNTTMNRVWKLNQSDIDDYTSWFNGGQVGSNPVNATAMEVINNWPAFNIDGSALAPFIDVNSNSAYDPNQGDYPKIKGDQAIFFVYNDKAGLHTESGGEPMGLEIQGMMYAYNCNNDSALYNTIFTNYKIINKSPFLSDSVFIGNWTDIDIGAGLGDHIGCDVTRGAYFGYNTVDPSVQAVVFLNGPYADPNGIDDAPNSTPNGSNYGDAIIDNERLGMSNFLAYKNNFTPTGNPTLALHYYDYLRNIWKDGTPVTYGNSGHLTSGPPSKYMYPGTSDPLGFGTGSPQPSWDQISAGVAPYDIRGLGSYGPFSFQPGAVQEIDFAYVYARSSSGGYTSSIALMQNRIDSIRLKYNNSTLAACGSINGIKKLNNNDVFSIYPNPATNTITIDFKTSSKNYGIKIYDVTGRMVKNNEQINTSKTIINIENLNRGIYLVNVFDGTASITHRFIKQ